MSYIPFVEKYRPTSFDSVILDPTNRTILQSILDLNHFPHLLLYGPPGTGKTTTIHNLIKQYQLQYYHKTTPLNILQFNSSDERGIETIRATIYQFTQTNSNEIKFVILDEVDSMTKIAQQALKNLVQTCHNTIFCIICNYISKLESGLINEFVKIHFNNLPNNQIHQFLTHIIQKEQLNIHPNQIQHIIQLYKSDIRSMINKLQTTYFNQHIPNDQTWETLLTHKNIQILQPFNLEIKSIFSLLLQYICNNHIHLLTHNIIELFKNAMHSRNLSPHLMQLLLSNILSKIDFKPLQSPTSNIQ